MLILRQDDNGPSTNINFGDVIDQATFDQILEMDDDDDEREFSKSIVYDFFTQAEGTFEKMDQYLYVQLRFYPMCRILLLLNASRGLYCLFCFMLLINQ